MNGKDILIVEDETIVALDMKMRLESLGYRILEVVDTGPAALAYLARNKPDLVLMDIKLKGGSDGIETARLARELVEVPIIFVTAFTDERTLERAKLVSPYGYVVKPFHERELRIAIELALYKFQYELSMRHSVELAQEANRLKGEFLANMSHELKTPLNSVIGFTELSLDRSRDEEQREYLATVLRSARSLVTLIDSILDFTRLEKSMLLPVRSTFSLDDLLGECADFLAVGAKSKCLDLSFGRDRRLPERIISDRDRIKQVLMNLLDNAIKFTEFGHVRLEATWMPWKGPSSSPGTTSSPSPSAFTLRLVVEDSGIGLAEEEIPKAFERFTQLDGSSTRQAGGTGLGLAIVEKSVELLDGSIHVTSLPGEGSRFEVLLPVLTDLDVPSSPVACGQNFAVVGFSPEAREDIEEILAYLGMTCMVLESLEAATKGQASYVLCDERSARAQPDMVRALRGRLIVACRPGFTGRAELAASGSAIIPYPVRAKPILNAMDILPCADSPVREFSRACAEIPSPPAGNDGPRMEEEKIIEGFEGLAVVLETAMSVGDLSEAERGAKEYHDLFQGLGSEQGRRLSFSALLLARKADWIGIADIIRRARIAPDSRLVHNALGGPPDAFPGR